MAEIILHIKETTNFSKILEDYPISAIILSIDDSNFAENIISEAHEKNIAVILDYSIKSLHSLVADGFHLAGEIASFNKIYKEMRAKFGENFSIGYDCNNSLDSAMEAAEKGADYVMFENDSDEAQEIINNWLALTTVPVVVKQNIEKINLSNINSIESDFILIPTEKFF